MAVLALAEAVAKMHRQDPADAALAVKNGLCTRCSGAGEVQGASGIARTCIVCLLPPRDDGRVPCENCDGAGEIFNPRPMPGFPNVPAPSDMCWMRRCHVCKGTGRRRIRGHEDMLGSIEPPNGALLFHDWLESHLPDGIKLSPVFPDEGLLAPVGEQPKPKRRKRRRSTMDAGAAWLLGPRRNHPRIADIEPQVKSAQPSDRPASFLGFVTELRRRLSGVAWSLPLSTDAKVDAAAQANERVTGESIADWYFELESDPARRGDAAAVLAYLTCHPRESRMSDAVDRIKDRLRAAGAPCPWSLVDFRPVSSRRTVRIRNSFIRTACNVLDDAGKTYGPNVRVARAFRVEPDDVRHVRIEHRHDREFLPKAEKSPR